MWSPKVIFILLIKSHMYIELFGRDMMYFKLDDLNITSFDFVPVLSISFNFSFWHEFKLCLLMLSLSFYFSFSL